MVSFGTVFCRRRKLDGASSGVCINFRLEKGCGHLWTGRSLWELVGSFQGVREGLAVARIPMGPGFTSTDDLIVLPVTPLQSCSYHLFLTISFVELVT